MQVHKLVKGIEGAKEYARLGFWESVEDLKQELQLSDQQIEDWYWLNEEEGGAPIEIEAKDEDFSVLVYTPAVIRSRTYLMQCPVLMRNGEVFMRESDFETIFC